MKTACLLLLFFVASLTGCEPGSESGAGGSGPGYNGVGDNSAGAGMTQTNHSAHTNK